METNVRRFFEKRNIIQANPVLATLHTTRLLFSFIFVCLLALLLVLFLLDTIFGNGQHFSEGPIQYSFILVLMVILLALTISQERYWKRIEQRRFAAVQGDRTLLAVEQPMTNPASLPLPITIKFRYSREYWLFAFYV